MADTDSAANREGLIYDWNEHARDKPRERPYVELDDETLRDGLQNPSVRNPSIEEKKEILLLMDQMGIDTADVGLPGAGPKHAAVVEELVTFMRDEGLKITPNCAARTVIADAEPVVRITQKTGVPIEICLFLGSSPIRRYAEEWDFDWMLRCVEESVTYSVKEGLPVMFVTEDTVRARPEDLKKMYTTAIECGARRICLCDTVGSVTPVGAMSLVSFAIEEIVKPSGEQVKVDWHGHRDRGMAMANSMAAIKAGANRVHACALGIGERVGNTPMERVLVNLNLMGFPPRNLMPLADYCKAVSRATGVPIPNGHPIVGRDAFETGTGVHASAVIKALRKGDQWLADRVYSGVPATEIGRAQKIRVGPMSGRSNIVWWLQENEYEATEDLVDRVFEAAKESPRLLEDEELHKIARG